MSDEVDFLHADKHESLLQIDSVILMGMVKHCQSSQNSEFAISLQYLKKKDGVNFFDADKHQKKFISTLWASKFSTRLILSLMDMIKHSQIVKVTSLQYLYNISKKQINVKVSTSWYYPF